MDVYQLIFSEKTSHRITRHGVFWIVFAIHVYLFRFYVYDLKYLSYPATYLMRLQSMLLFLPASVFCAYFSMYYVLPHYILKAKYARFIIIIIILSAVLILISYTLSVVFNVQLAWDMPATRANIVRQSDFTLNNGIVYPLTVSGFAIGIKMSKNFYIQQKQNAQLAIQKINADVQLLKSQVHPRFLFHSLQTIHDDLIQGTHKSPGMLLRLSELLSYILYESDASMPLAKELELLRNYIELEKSSWGDQLVVTFYDKVQAENKYIEPLLLLPLAECVFDNLDKHKQLQVCLDIYMEIMLGMFCLNMTVSGLDEIPVPGLEENIQLVQVQKRLQAEYRTFESRLEAFSVAGSFSIILTLKIDKANEANTQQPLFT